MRFWALALSTLVCLGGCFSGDDFSDCSESAQCGFDRRGRARVCRGGECVFLDPGPISLPYRGNQTPEILAPGQAVLIEDVRSLGQSLRIEADIVIISGHVDLDGRGGLGGGGGGGGGCTAGFVGGDGGERGSAQAGTDGDPGTADAPGEGGQGGVGAGEGGGASGSGGTADRAAGGAGRPGRFSAVSDACDGQLRLGSGGGGGGGGLGGRFVEAECLAGGGGGGGVGGRGGGSIQIIARRYIEVRGGKLTARGLAAPDDADLAAAEGDCKVGEACVPENCTEGDGRAGASGDSDAPGATRGGSQGGDGGRGGGGSGGMIYLEAPRIVLSADAELDVSGSEGASNGGLIGVRGLIEGAALAPGGVAEGLFCHTDR